MLCGVRLHDLTEILCELGDRPSDLARSHNEALGDVGLVFRRDLGVLSLASSLNVRTRHDRMSTSQDSPRSIYPTFLRAMAVNVSNKQEKKKKIEI